MKSDHSITTITDEAKITLDNLVDLTGNLVSPTLRFGVTGLSRSGKTVFITALVHNFIHGGRLPLFEPWQSGRFASAGLQPQPSMAVPRFQYEDHVRTLVESRIWPESTRAISELRLTIKYESASAWGRAFGPGTLNIDIVDYPGEWLLDLPLLGMDFKSWSAKALDLARDGKRSKLSAKWLARLMDVKAEEPVEETLAIELASLFTSYLRDCREDETAFSTLPPGRFLMPGDLEGSPAITFCPLPAEMEPDDKQDSLYSMMADRFEAYKQFVIMPFFREHFARIDRQIVLVDALQAINAGPEALSDLELALSDILTCFRPGRPGWLAPLFGRRIGRILFAATKADHLHHKNHDRLEAVLRKLVSSAIDRAQFSGAEVDVLALSAIRATREAILRQDGEELPVITGTPLPGERIGKDRFDGKTETAIFPGDLPSDPAILFDRNLKDKDRPELRFIRFRPPELETTAEGTTLSLPHIRLDRALNFLFADKLA
ncbi:MAG: YcjX family protein [Rhizobiaceae bacterium]